jgi:hypothetical protein
MWQSVPLDTAIALSELIAALGGNEHALASADGRSPRLNIVSEKAERGIPLSAQAQRQAIGRGVECLLQYQGLDGHWNPSPWIKMEIGRAQGAPARTATYQSATLTTAFCLPALLAVNRMCEHTDI